MCRRMPKTSYAACSRCTPEQGSLQIRRCSTQHEWIKLKAPRARNVELESAKDQIFAYLKILEKARALPIIRAQNEDEMMQLRDVLMMIDRNGDGLVTVNEMKEGLSKAGLKDIPVDWKQEVDSDGSVEIDYTEVLAASLDRMYSQEDACWAFRVFDRSGDGKISMAELQQVPCARDVAEEVGTKAIAETISATSRLEVDGKVIDFKEFMPMVRDHAKGGGGMAHSTV